MLLLSMDRHIVACPVLIYRCSILLIHGLTGHAINTWSHGGICWPRDLLPQALKIPTRVLSFGYDAGRYGDANLDIEDAALQLISELERVRPVKVTSRSQVMAVLAPS